MPEGLPNHSLGYHTSSTRETSSMASNKDSSATKYEVMPTNDCTTNSATSITQAAEMPFYNISSSSDVLTASKTTLTTSTILPPSSLGPPLPASTSDLPVAHTSHTSVVPIAVGVICGVIPIAILLFMGCWRWRKPESFQKRRDQATGWYNSVRQRCYIHNFGWGFDATWQRLKETRARNREYGARRKASTSTSTINLTGDGRNTRTEKGEKQNVMQKWRQKREQEMLARRERREAMDIQKEEQEKEIEERERRWQERSQDPRVAEAEAGWEKVKRENRERYKALDERDERDLWWRDDIRGAGSEADTTLAGSRVSRGDGSEESWVEKWRMMGDELPPNLHESQRADRSDQIHPAIRQ